MKKILTGLLFAVLLGSCSMMKLGYNNADWLLTWRIDDYFDLTSDQEDFVEEQLEKLISWHRNNELPRYSALIDEMILRVQRGISGEDYEWAINQFLDAYETTINKAIPDATTLLMDLDSSQISYYQEKTAEWYAGNDNKEQPQRTEQEQKERRYNRTIERMEEWLGELDDNQKEIIKELSFQLPLRNQYFREDRERRHKAFVDLLKSDLSQEQFAARLKTHFTDFDDGRSEEYKQASVNYNEASKKMAVEISKILNISQIEHAFEKVRGYQVDFIELASSQ
jgi:hypothetical protein